MIPKIEQFRPNAARIPNDRWTDINNNSLQYCNKLARMRQWLLALRTLADRVDVLIHMERPELLSALCYQSAQILKEKGAKQSAKNLEDIGYQLLDQSRLYYPMDRASERILPALNEGAKEISAIEFGEPLNQNIDLLQSIVFIPHKSDIPLSPPAYAYESEKALFKLVFEELGAYEQNQLCLKLDGWSEMAIALIKGGLSTEFPHPQRTVAEKMLIIANREQVLFVKLEGDKSLELEVLNLLENHLRETMPHPGRGLGMQGA